MARSHAAGRVQHSLAHGHGTRSYTSETYGSTKQLDYPQDTDTDNDPSATGTFTRFGYFPAYDIFVLCNDPRNDC